LKLTRVGSRALVQSKGFVPVAQESGMLIAYATAEGELASDAGARAGTYATALAEEIVKPGIEAVVMFRNVQRRVRAAIKQEPYLGFNAMGDVYLAGSSRGQALAPPSEAAEAWDRTKDATSLSVLEAFVARYGKTFYAELARSRINELKTQQVAAAAKLSSSHELDDRCDHVRVFASGSSLCIRPGHGFFRDCWGPLNDDLCGPMMMVVPAGEYMMGSPAQEAGRGTDEGPVHKVSIQRPFAIGGYEVTFVEWEACVKGGGCTSNPNPSDSDGGRGRRPVINVSWHDAQEYVAWLSRQSGKTYRLPSEAEWEYAARASSTTAYAFGDTIKKNQAQYSEGTWGSARKTVEVGTFQPNKFGLYDMHGNASEWVEDTWRPSYHGGPNDGTVWVGSVPSHRVMRGGSWYGDAGMLRSAKRFNEDAGGRYITSGFRVLRVL
jgi:formylglycine-generating enzyme required for sulfatase activity